MAKDKDKSQDQDQDQDQDQGRKPNPSDKKNILIIVLIGIICLLIGGGGSYFIFSGSPVEKKSAKASINEKSIKEDLAKSEEKDRPEPEKSADEETKDGEDEQSTQDQEESAVKIQAQYINLKPITVNYTVNNKQRYLQITISLMTRDAAVAAFVEANQPLLQNNLLLLMSSYNFEELTTLQGKEKLRTACLEEAQKIVQQELGEGKIEQVLFFNFILQ